jgi:cytochrome b561
MAHHSPAQRYDPIAMAFHWAIALLMLVDFGLALSFSKFRPGDLLYFNDAYTLHMSVGMSVLALSVLRLGWRLAHRFPPAPKEMPTVMRLLARTTHVLLYVGMIAAPVSGWIVLSVRKKPPVLFGTHHWPNVPYLAQLNHPQRTAIHQVMLPGHIELSYIAMSLVAVHVLAALYHHYFRRDDVLVRMLPQRRYRSAHTAGRAVHN